MPSQATSSIVGHLYQYHTSMYTYPLKDEAGDTPGLLYDIDDHRAWTDKEEIVIVMGIHTSMIKAPSGPKRDHVRYFLVYRKDVGIRMAECVCFMKCANRLN